MECPFCAENIKYETIVCKHCSRDLRVVRPVLLEIQELVFEFDKLQQELDRMRTKLERIKHPIRYFVAYSTLYVLAPIILLVVSHILVTIVFNMQPIYLRLVSVIISVSFGFVAYAISRLESLEVFPLGLLAAAISVVIILVITGFNDGVPILPASHGEWREVGEYVGSICLAFVTGNILSVLVFRVLPGTLLHGRPTPAAFRLARILGPHVGDDQLRRRARLIQDLLRTVGPLAGAAATTIGALYAGLKGVIGQ